MNASKMSVFYVAPQQTRKWWRKPGEKKAPGIPYSSLPVPEGDQQESWRGTFYKDM